MNLFWYCLLASYALTRYVTQESGPRDLLVKVRSRVSKWGAGWAKWIVCSVCFVASAGAFFTLVSWIPFFDYQIAYRIVYLFAVIGGALLLIDIYNAAVAIIKQLRLFVRVVAVAFDVEIGEPEANEDNQNDMSD